MGRERLELEAGRSWPAILRNALASNIRQITDIIVFLVVMQFLIRVLGLERLGLWSLIWSVVAFFALADLGFAPAVVRFVADGRGRGAGATMRGVVCTMFWVYSGLALALIAIAGAGALWFGDVFGLAADQRDVSRDVVLLLGLGSAAALPLRVFDATLRGVQKLAVAERYETLATLLYAAGVFVWMRNDPQLATLAALTSVRVVVPLAAMSIHCRATLDWISLHPRHFDRQLVPRLWSFSGYFLICQLSALVYTRVDAMIIHGAFALGTVAIYSVSMRLAEKAVQFCGHLAHALEPIWAEMSGAGEDARLRALWLKSTKLAVGFATPLLLGLAALAMPLIDAFAGPEFAPATPVIRWLAAAGLLTVLHANTNGVLAMVGHQRYVAFATVVVQSGNVLLSIALVRSTGIVGVAFASFLAQVAFGLLLQHRAARAYGSSIWGFYRATALPSVGPGLAMLVFLLALQAAVPIQGLLAVAIAEAAGIALFLLAFWALGLDARERGRVRAQLLEIAGG